MIESFVLHQGTDDPKRLDRPLGSVRFRPLTAFNQVGENAVTLGV